MSLVLHYAPWSSAMTCHWALEELGVPHEKVRVDLANKGTQTPQFLALNPNGKVPVLVHDGTPIFESIAILAYLGETFGVDKGLFPAPGIARAQALQWLAWTNVTLGPCAHRYQSNTSDAVPPELRNAKVAHAARAEVDALLDIVERHLSSRSWMVGDGFSLVDLHLAGAMSWVARMGFDMKSRPNLDAWATRSKARPAFAATLGA